MTQPTSKRLVTEASILANDANAANPLRVQQDARQNAAIAAAISRDTGARIITGQVAGISAYNLPFTIRRTGSTVSISLPNFTTTSVNVDNIYVPPAGFQAGGIEAFQAGMVESRLGDPTYTIIYTTGSVGVKNCALSGALNKGILTYQTFDAWPTTLPGVAA
jgi:hypothetical protein